MTQAPFLALITPIGSTPEPPTSNPPGYPTHPWVPPYGPSHPIAPGGPPPRPWGPVYYPDQGLPGQQPGIWGGGGVGDYIDAGFPGPQPGRPGRPTHPIYWPPVIWDPSRPTNPIVNPGDPDHPGAGQPDRTPKIEWKTAWSPTTGWVVVGVPTGEHVTPSGEGEED